MKIEDFQDAQKSLIFDKWNFVVLIKNLLIFNQYQMLIMSFYNQISKGYDELYKEEQLKKLNIVKNNLDVKNNDLLLDVGCGTGISSQFDCKVIGIDPSIELLKQNRELKINSFVEKLPVKDNVFDIVISITAIHNFNDIEKSFKEIKRVGKNKFVFSILRKSKKFDEIKNLIKKYFNIKEVIEEDKDAIFFVKNKY